MESWTEAAFSGSIKRIKLDAKDRNLGFELVVTGWNVSGDTLATLQKLAKQQVVVQLGPITEQLQVELNLVEEVGD